MPISRAALAMTGAAPVPVPPPMPAVTKTMCAPARWSRISSSASSAAALPISGLEPAPSPSVTWRPIWMMRSARDEVSAWASVLATMKSTPESPETIMLLTALPPAPPTPQTMMRGFNSLSSGAFRLIDISCLIPLGARRRRFDFRQRLSGTPLPTRIQDLLRSSPSTSARPEPHIRLPRARAA